MSIKQGLTTKQREKELIKLIKDAEELSFNPILITKYKKQLEGIRADLRDREKKKVKSCNLERGLN